MMSFLLLPDITVFNWLCRDILVGKKSKYHIFFLNFKLFTSCESLKNTVIMQSRMYVTLDNTANNHSDERRSRYAPLFSIVGVVGGTYLMFKFLSPDKTGSVVSDEERRQVRGGSTGQSPFGTVSARPPRSTSGN